MYPTKKIGLIAALSSFALPLAALAWDATNTGLSASGNAAALNTGSDVPTIVGTVIKYALSLVGVIFLVLMVYAGVIWMTARGDEARVSKAKDTIIAAIIGIIVVVASYAITNFVIGAFSQPAGGAASATLKERGAPCSGSASGSECKSNSCTSATGEPGTYTCD
jgi:hypothetical protein